MKLFGLPVQWLRAGVTVVVVLDLLALAAFSVRVSTTTTRTVNPLAQSRPAANTSVPTATPSASTPALVPPVSVPIAIAAAVGDAPHQSPPSSPTASPTGTVSPPPVPTASAQQACPVALPPPTQTGGLQSLIDFAPAFGPFSAEAFAAAAAYQPALRLIGPILAEYPALAPKLNPLLTPFVQAVGDLLTTVDVLLGPLYAPYRTKVLQAETKLAAFIAPYAQSLANSPLGGCVIDLEASLIEGTK